MVLDPLLVTYAGLALLLTLSPGPDMALVTRNAAAHGFPGGVRSGLGVCAGLTFHATLAAVGLSVVLARSDVAFLAVRVIGAAYLVYLGARSLHRAWRGTVEEGSGEGTGGRPFVEGVVTNVLNPKVAVFYLALLPQFVRPGDPFLARAFLLAGIHIGWNLAWLPTYARLVHETRQRFPAERVRRGLEGIAGGALVLLGARIAWEEGVGV